MLKYLMVCFPILSFASLAGAASPLVVEVTRFGAIPNDGRDDTHGRRRAIEACRQSPGSNLLFPRGRYDFAEGQNPAAPRVEHGISGNARTSPSTERRRFSVPGPDQSHAVQQVPQCQE